VRAAPPLPAPPRLIPRRPSTDEVRRRVQELWPEVAPTVIWLGIAIVMSVALALVHSPLVPLPGVATLLVIPGAAVMSLLKTRPANTAGRIVLAVCLSMMFIMIVGCIASLVGPHIGIAHPLNPWPESVIWIILAVLVLVACARRHSDPVTLIFGGVRTVNIAVVLAGGVLVVLSILGVAQLNYTGDAHLAVFATALDVIVLLVAVVGAWQRNSQWPLNTLLYCVSLALLLSTSLRGAHLYGWDIQQEFGVASQTIRNGVWVVPADHDPYASMLSLTVLPTVLHSLVRLRLLAFFQLVVPAVLALLPLAVFSTVRNVPRWITSGRPQPRPGLALAVVIALVVSSVAFSSELVSITRQAMALTMLSALVMVLFDRTILKRAAQITVGLLIVAVSFTHYTTSYLLAVIVCGAWVVSSMWSKGWLGTPKARIEKHQYDVHKRRIINIVLVIVSLVAAFGWNLAITRNSALAAPSSAITAKGAGLVTSTGSSFIAPRDLERLLVNELQKTDSWIARLPGSRSVPLVAAKAPPAPALIPSFARVWNELSFIGTEGLWVVLGIALLYGILRLGRRLSYQYSADLVGLAAAGLMIGGFLRFSGTLAAYYSPERAAIFTAILLCAPVTLFLDDLVTFLYDPHIFHHRREARVILGVGAVFLAVLLIVASGLGAVWFAGQPPGELSANDLNVQQFAITTSEYATANWLRTNIRYPSLVQTDLYGQLVLLSVPGGYGVVNEIVPPEVDNSAYIYLSQVNLGDDSTQVDVGDGQYLSLYHTTINFFNKNFYVVYSTGTTRVYHGPHL
jgi:uncharacterized membrane protein